MEAIEDQPNRKSKGIVRQCSYELEPPKGGTPSEEIVR